MPLTYTFGAMKTFRDTTLTPPNYCLSCLTILHIFIASEGTRQPTHLMELRQKLVVPAHALPLVRWCYDRNKGWERAGTTSKTSGATAVAGPTTETSGASAVIGVLVQRQKLGVPARLLVCWCYDRN